MPLDEHDLKLLWDMLRAAQDAAELTGSLSKEQYLQSKLHRLACERLVEIIGEAARKVSPEARASLPDLEWGAIVATRHIMAHQYDEVDHEKLWRIVTVHASSMVAQLRPILAAHPPGPESHQDPGQP